MYRPSSATGSNVYLRHTSVWSVSRYVSLNSEDIRVAVLVIVGKRTPITEAIGCNSSVRSILQAGSDVGHHVHRPVGVVAVPGGAHEARSYYGGTQRRLLTGRCLTTFSCSSLESAPDV